MTDQFWPRGRRRRCLGIRLVPGSEREKDHKAHPIASPPYDPNQPLAVRATGRRPGRHVAPCSSLAEGKAQKTHHRTRSETSQSLTVLSVLPEASIRPLGVKATEFT